MNQKTPADLLFEGYLVANGHTGFRYEEPLPGTDKTPDYQLPWHGGICVFEVKGFEAAPVLQSGYFDPYGPIREKINTAIRQFRDLREHSCSLVLHYSGPGLILLDPLTIFAAMLGNVGVEIPLAADGRGLDSALMRRAFLTGGKMIRYSKGAQPSQIAPQNTRINAIIAVEHFAIGERLFAQHWDATKAAAGRELSAEDCLAEAERFRGSDLDSSRTVLRCRVHQNPYAHVPLPQDLFKGPYDEWHGPDSDGQLVRQYAGAELTKLGGGEL